MNHVKICNWEHEWCAIEVPRCGCTTLKTIAAEDHFVLTEDVINIHEFLGYDNVTSNGIIQPYTTPVDLFTFAVWRNPIDRAISRWRSFTQDEDNAPKSFSAFKMTGFTEYAKGIKEMMLKYGSTNIDVHVRRQCDFYNMRDIDLLVPLPLLNKFLLERFGYMPMPKLTSSKAIRTHNQITEEGKNIINKIYSKDLELPEQAGMKLYK